MDKKISATASKDLDFFVEGNEISAEYFEKTLENIFNEIEFLSLQKELSPSDYVSLISLFNNASYILLYLESNSQHFKVTFLSKYRAMLEDNPKCNKRLVALLQDLNTKSPELETSRLSLIKSLNEMLLDSSHNEAAGYTKRSELEKNFLAIQMQLDQIGIDRQQFLERLGVGIGANNPNETFYKLLSITNSNESRNKMDKVWNGIGEFYDQGIIRSIDKVVEIRWKNNGQSIYPRVIDKTLESSKLDLPRITSFLRDTLPVACNIQEQLETKLLNLYGTGSVRAHFPRLIHDLREGITIPKVPLLPCIEFLLYISAKVFGLTSSSVENTHSHILSYDIFLNGERTGRINFDLWGGSLGRKTNTTYGIKNRTDCEGILQLPVAHISCRFKSESKEGIEINFQNAHSLFHEFGHAINHILLKQKLPNLSGLNYLPIERLEILSMWFERWVFHPDFGCVLGFNPEKNVALRVCQEIKRLEYIQTHLERQILSIIDLDIHSNNGQKIQDCLNGLSSQYPTVKHSRLTDILPYFMWPMLTANPGGYFSYLWAAADSADRFKPFLKLNLSNYSMIRWPHVNFEDCFDYATSSITPNPSSIFTFYEQEILG